MNQEGCVVEKRVREAIGVVLIILVVGSACQAGLVFRMTADQTTLLVGETVTVHVWAWADDPCAVAGNGLGLWQMDLDVVETDGPGVVKITDTAGVADIDLIAPAPLDGFFSGWDPCTVNQPVSGEARQLTVLTTASSSDTGVGTGDGDINNPANWAGNEIFSFQIEAMTPGTATYTLKDDGGAGFLGDLVDGDTQFDGFFDVPGSDRLFTVLPEPGTLALVATVGVIACRRRQRSKRIASS